MKSESYITLSMTEQDFGVLLEMAAQVGMSISVMFSRFAADLISNPMSDIPPVNFAHCWHSIYVPAVDKPSPFAGWLSDCSCLTYFFFLFDSIYVHITEFEIKQCPDSGLSVRQRAFRHMERILKSALEENTASGSQPCRHEMKIFPDSIQDLFCKAVLIMVDFYREYVVCNHIPPEEQNTVQNILTVFGLWMDRTLRN